MALERVRKLRRSTKLLQLFSLMMMGVGALCLLPLPNANILGGFGVKMLGLATLTSGGAGVVGLAFTWHRALVLFTSASWFAALLAVYGTLSLIFTRPVNVNPFPWFIWCASLVVALPPSILSSTMHILRVWRTQPMVSSTTEPLVNAVDDDLPPADEVQPAASGSSAVPSWPPPPGEQAYSAMPNPPSPPPEGGGASTSAGRPAWPPPVD